MTMKRATPFHEQLYSLAGDSPWAEPMLWSSSVLLGIIICKAVYSIMKASSPSYSVAYTKLSKLEKIEWDNRGFSTVHALIVSGAAAYLFFFTDFFNDSGVYGPVVFRSSIFSQTILGISLGYFFSDLAMILWLYPALGGKEYILHHLLSMISIAMSLYSAQAHVYIYFVLLTEITTPLVNLRWYLTMAGLKNSKPYIINGILLFIIWFFARVFLFVHFFLHIFLHYDQVNQVFAAGFYFLFTAPPGLALMNVFWFYKIAKGLLRAMSKRA